MKFPYHGGRWCIHCDSEMSDREDRRRRDLVTCLLRLKKCKQQHWRDLADSHLCVSANKHVECVFTWRRQQVVDVDGFRAVGSSEQLLLQPLPQRRVGLDASLQLQPQMSDLRQQLAQVHRAGGRDGDGLLGHPAGFCWEEQWGREKHHHVGVEQEIKVQNSWKLKQQ